MPDRLPLRIFTLPDLLPTAGSFKTAAARSAALEADMGSIMLRSVGIGVARRVYDTLDEPSQSQGGQWDHEETPAFKLVVSLVSLGMLRV